jgi:hypothetical protein
MTASRRRPRCSLIFKMCIQVRRAASRQWRARALLQCVRIATVYMLTCFSLHAYALVCVLLQRDPFDWSETMYELYTHSILNYLLSKVDPSFKAARTQPDVHFLKEWTKRWANQKLIVQGLSKLFMYLDRFYTPVSERAIDRQQRSVQLQPGVRVRASLHVCVILMFVLHLRSSLSPLSAHSGRIRTTTASST